MEGGAQIGAQEQETMHEHSVPEPASELPENEGEMEEEARSAKPLRDPHPTAAERAIHEATHLPFRSWSAQCVAQRRNNLPHRRVPQDENAVPKILMDFLLTHSPSKMMYSPFASWRVRCPISSSDDTQVVAKPHVGGQS